jgi:hypothetical protein
MRRNVEDTKRGPKSVAKICLHSFSSFKEDFNFMVYTESRPKPFQAVIAYYTELLQNFSLKYCEREL